MSLGTDKILIDTSAWVNFLTDKEGALGNMVAMAIERNQAALCGVVIAELLQGALGKPEQKKLNFLFSHVESLPMTESVMLKAGELLQKQRAQGLILPLTDAVVAAVALEQGVPVLSADQILSYFEGITLVGVR